MQLQLFSMIFQVTLLYYFICWKAQWIIIRRDQPTSNCITTLLLSRLSNRLLSKITIGLKRSTGSPNATDAQGCLRQLINISRELLTSIKLRIHVSEEIPTIGQVYITRQLRNIFKSSPSTQITSRLIQEEQKHMLLLVSIIKLSMTIQRPSESILNRSRF